MRKNFCIKSIKATFSIYLVLSLGFSDVAYANEKSDSNGSTIAIVKGDEYDNQLDELISTDQTNALDSGSSANPGDNSSNEETEREVSDDVAVIGDLASTVVPSAEAVISSDEVEGFRLDDLPKVESLPELAIVRSSVSENKSLDVAGGSILSGAKIQIYDDNVTPAQRFELKKLGNGAFVLVNLGSRMALGVKGSLAEDGATIEQQEYDGSAAQAWNVLSVGDGTFVFESQLKDGLVLDVRGGSNENETPLQVYSANGTSAQRFSLGTDFSPIENGTYNLATIGMSAVLDIAGAFISDGANAQMYEHNGTAAQLFTFNYDKSTGYYLVETFSGKSLDVAGGSAVSGTNVQQYSSNDTYAQKWAIEVADGGYCIRSACGGLALDVSGGSGFNGVNVQVFAPNGTHAQIWKFNKWSSDLKSGLYSLTSAINDDYVVEVAGGNVNACANVQLYTSNGTWAQKFDVVVRDDGYCVFYSLESGMVIDVAGGGGENGSNVQQYPFNGTDAQLWQPIYFGGDTYGFKSKCNGLYLDVNGAQMQTGANVQVWEANGSLAQRFNTVSVDRAVEVTEGSYVIASVVDGLVFDIAGASSENGSVMQLYSGNNTYAQKYQIIRSGSQKYCIVNIHSSKYVDVDTNTNSKIQQWSRNGGLNQIWEFCPVGVGSNAYFIKSASTGKYFSNDDGVLDLRDYDGTQNQQFTLNLTNAFKVYLDAGHGYNSNGNGQVDAGACSMGYRESDLTADLVSRIAENLDAKSIEYYIGYGIAYWNRQEDAAELGCTSLLSIHFNAGGGTGSESYIHSYNAAFGSETYQSILHPYLIAGTSLYDRGMKQDAFAVCGGRLPATLLEIAFIDNYYDMETYNDRKNTISMFIAAGLEEAAKDSSCSWS